MDNPMKDDGQNNDFGTASFHIDERLQQVLGHYRPYFQEVPLANCHSVNFGRYGSFLPDCQHSPCNSPFQDISQHVLSYNVSKSPQTAPLDVFQRKNGPDTTLAEVNPSRHKVSGKGSVICASDQSDDPMPKIHIKLNGETFTTPKNKNIHQSLGLYMSSSSSDGDIPICGCHFVGSAGGATASPSGIVESMTTIPILEDIFLSPLSDILISLVETPREVDRHSCGSVSRDSNPLIGDISCLYEMLEYKTNSPRDVCDRFDSVEKRVVKYPVCLNSPAKDFSPEPRGMSTSLMEEMENITNNDPKYRSACRAAEMIIQKGILQDSDDPKSYKYTSPHCAEDDAKDGSISSTNKRTKILLKSGSTGDNRNDNLSGKKKMKLEHPHGRQNSLDTSHYNNSYIPLNSGAKGLACRRKIHNMETSFQEISFYKNQAKCMTKEVENIQLSAEKPSVEAAVLSKVPGISKDEHYVNAVKISPLRSAALCLISSPRECLEHQDACISNPREGYQSRYSNWSTRDGTHRVETYTRRGPVELPKLIDEANKPIREANDLKFCANGLKSSGLQIESTEIFFHAALKYLDAASLLETHASGSAKNVPLTPCKIYDTTAKLLEYCAQEYESCSDMACAALAYKCLEASNMQIVYSTDYNARRDCQELQVSIQSLTSGITSPVTNASNDFTSSQLNGSFLDSRNRSMFVQLLNFAHCANSAMEASRKSQITFGYASKILEETGSTEVVDCVKRALNHGFHDMKKLLHLVHEAMEALSS